MPEIGIPDGIPDISAVTPHRPLDATTVGRADIGTLNMSQSSLSQVIVLMSKSIVREAFEASVTKLAPAVKFQMIHESIVPNASSTPIGTFPDVSNHSAFDPEK